MTESRLFYCQGCNEHWPEERFEFYADRNGRRAPRKQCRVCNGELGHKVCSTCKVDKPIDKFKAERKANRHFSISYNKNCWQCIYARRKELRTIGYRQPRPGRPRKNPAPEMGPRRLASGKRPVGWTPPPTAERLAEIHWKSKPLPGFERPEGDQCA